MAERAMVDRVIARAEEANEGHVAVVCEDDPDVAKQGMVALGAAVGTPACVASRFEETFRKKKWIRTFSQHCRRRSNCFCRGTANDVSTTPCARIARPRPRGMFVVKSPIAFWALRQRGRTLSFRASNVAPQDLTPQQQRQVLARFQMLGKDGGSWVCSLVEDGECSQLAMISEHLHMDESQATNIDWLKG